VTVTHRRAMAIGTRLALSHGVHGGIALLRSRQSVLDVAIGPHVAAIAMLVRLGKTLATVPVAAARTRANRVPPTYAFEQAVLGSARSDPLDAAARRMATPHVTFMPVTADRPATSLILEEDGAHGALLLAANPLSQHNGDGGSIFQVTPRLARMDTARDAPSPRRLSGQKTREASIAQATAGDSHARTVMQPPTDVPSLLPAMQVASPIIAGIPSFAPVADMLSPIPELTETRSIPSMMQTISSAPVSEVSIANLGRRPDQREQPATRPQYTSAAPLEDVSAAPIDTPGPQVDAPTYSAGVTPAPQSYLSSDYQPQDAMNAAATDDQSRSAQADQQPRQGTIVLDGAELGRWVISYLENEATRPGTMTTGIDPRMTATFPGAPTGG
jgi:hypothetical protein